MSAPHPRLYFDAAERDVLSSQRHRGPHAKIWRNLELDAGRAMALPPARDWIAPRLDDPCYENLYDRFWAMMADVANVEQLAFAASYGADETVVDAARAHLNAACARWRAEADLAPDYGTAYATTRMLKAIAIGYDLLHERLSDEERAAIRGVLVTCAERLSSEWFDRREIRGPVGIEPGRHSPHHSSVEWSAFGIVALCLLDEVPEAAGWLARAERQFADHLIAGALAADGSQVEGTAFWASTVLSQVQFLDPLRRVTGVDLLAGAVRGLDTSLARAAYRPLRECTGEGEPLYGESTGMSAVLYAVAGERGDAVLQCLAQAEPTTGRTEAWPARTPRRREQMRFAPGGYAYAWCRADLQPGPAPPPCSLRFPLVDEAYLRTGWDEGDMLVAIRTGKISVYVDSRLVFEDLTPSRVVEVERSRSAGTGIYRHDPPDLVTTVTECGVAEGILWARGADPDGKQTMAVDLDLVRRRVVIRRSDGASRTCVVDRYADCTFALRRGRLEESSADGYRPDLSAGYGQLQVVETNPRSYPTVTVSPRDAQLELILTVAALRR